MAFRLGMAPPGSNAFDFGNLDTIPAAADESILVKQSGTWTELPAGSNGQFVGISGGVVTYLALPGGGDMLAATYDPTAKVGDAFDLANFAIAAEAQGDMYSRGAAGWQRIPIDAAGRIWTSNGPAADPSWQNPSGDMTAAVYDPTAVAGDAFDLANFEIASAAPGDLYTRGAGAWERLPVGAINSIVNVDSATGRPAYTKARKEVGWFRVATAISANTGTETIIGVTNTAAPRTITIPSADILVSDRIWVVKDESGGAGTNNITVASQGAETFDGAANVVITANHGVARIYSDGTNLFTW